MRVHVIGEQWLILQVDGLRPCTVVDGWCEAEDEFGPENDHERVFLIDIRYLALVGMAVTLHKVLKVVDRSWGYRCVKNADNFNGALVFVRDEGAEIHVERLIELKKCLMK